MKYYLGRGDEANYVSGALLVAQVASLPLYVWLARRTSKRAGYLAGAGVWMLTMLSSVLVTPAAPVWFVYVFAVLVGLGTGGIVVMIYAMFPDIPDVDELVTGQRREGAYSSIFTFSRKASSAVALFLISNTLALAGYVPDAAQTPQFISALRAVFVVAPLALVGLAFAAALRYPLSPARHARLSALLRLKRGGQALTSAQLAEERALRRELIG